MYGKSAFIAAAITNKKNAPKILNIVQQMGQHPGPSAFFVGPVGARERIALYSAVQSTTSVENDAALRENPRCAPGRDMPQRRSDANARTHGYAMSRPRCAAPLSRGSAVR